MSKERKCFRLSVQDVDYINSLAEKYQIDSTKALERIIEEHRQSEKLQELSKTLTADMLSAFDEKYNKIITRIRLASNGAERSSLILLEMMNSLLISSNYNQYAYTSRIAKSDVWVECEKEVNRRINEFKQRKDNKKQGD